MNTHTPIKTFDLSGFHYSGTRAFDVRRSAEVARAEFIGGKLMALGRWIFGTPRATGELFRFAQQQNQAARL